jgi:sortase A
MERHLYQAQARETFAELGKPAQPEPRVEKALRSFAPPPPMAKLEIARLHVSGFVEDGLDSETLSRAIGHSPQSAKLGERGNVVLAAHRDTFFAGLKDVRTGDAIEVEAADGKVYRYKVTRILIIDPTEDWVLKSDPSRNMLTLITCYPFQFIGSAPNRLVVQAEPVGSSTVPSGSLLSRDRKRARSASEGI